jgi:heat shock protein HslJ
MKKTVIVMIIAFLAFSCKSAEKTASFTDVPDKEWKLIEVHINGKNSGFSRNSISNNAISDIYTLRFNTDMISGTGAPNRYNAPYTVGENRAIKIELVRATLMAAIGELSTLREYDYFGYVQNAYRWNVVNERLELYSKLENGSEIKLVFSL